MIDFIRSLPQGVFWYPLVLILVFALGRVVATMSRVSRRQRSAEKRTHVPGRYAHLVALATSDAHAREELERLCVGLLLDAAGYGGYSVERCRALKIEVAGSELEQALAYHLGDARQLPPEEGIDSRQPAESQGGRTLAGIGALPRVCQIVIREVERRTEE